MLTDAVASVLGKKPNVCLFLSRELQPCCFTWKSRGAVGKENGRWRSSGTSSERTTVLRKGCGFLLLSKYYKADNFQYYSNGKRDTLKKTPRCLFVSHENHQVFPLNTFLLHFSKHPVVSPSSFTGLLRTRSVSSSPPLQPASKISWFLAADWANPTRCVFSYVVLVPDPRHTFRSLFPTWPLVLMKFVETSLRFLSPPTLAKIGRTCI